MSWLAKAVCSKDKNSQYWLSYNQDKIAYAKEGCERCAVQKECIFYAFESNDDPAGVVAGTSEFDRKILKWKKVTDINGNNWK